jgi:antitoxin component of MazEF toxin-antitoxin module
MIKKLTPIGNSLGLIIDKPILELLGFDRDTPLKISTDGKRLTIEAGEERPRQKVIEAANEILDTHHETFRKLAQ